MSLTVSCFKIEENTDNIKSDYRTNNNVESNNQPYYYTNDNVSELSYNEVLKLPLLPENILDIKLNKAEYVDNTNLLDGHQRIRYEIIVKNISSENVEYADRFFYDKEFYSNIVITADVVGNHVALLHLPPNIEAKRGFTVIFKEKSSLNDSQKELYDAKVHYLVSHILLNGKEYKYIIEDLEK